MAEFTEYFLKEIGIDDLKRVLEWRNSKRIRDVMFNDRIITETEHIDWFNKLSTSKNSMTKIFMYRERAVGVVNITHIDTYNSRCSWGFYLGETILPRYSGKIMGYLALDYIFREIGIRKICAEILDSNTRSINFHKFFGFTQEGRLSKHILKSCVYRDVTVMALFRDEWDTIKDSIKKILLQ